MRDIWYKCKTPAQTSRGFVLFRWLSEQSNLSWISQTVLAGYVGSGYLNAWPDVDQLYTQAFTTTSPQLEYTINFTTTGTYYVWLRGYAPNGAGDSIFLELDGQEAITPTKQIVTGFDPRIWSWANNTLQETTATIEITEPGLYTLRLLQREDGLRLDRIVLSTDSGYNPIGNGPPESDRIGD